MDEAIKTLQKYVSNGDHKSAIDLLREKPGLITEKTTDGISFLLLAAYHNNQPLVDYILEQKPTLEYYEASATGKTEVVASFLDRFPELIDSFSKDGFTALGLAAFFGHHHTVNLLLERGAQINLAANNGMAVAPLHAAVAKGYFDIAKSLLDKGADPNLQQTLGVTPLHSAAHQGNSAMVNLLLQYQADAQIIMDNGKKPIDLANDGGHQEVIDLLS